MQKGLGLQWNQVERYDYFSELVEFSRTLAVFAGHLHPTGGMPLGKEVGFRVQGTQP